MNRSIFFINIVCFTIMVVLSCETTESNILILQPDPSSETLPSMNNIMLAKGFVTPVKIHIYRPDENTLIFTSNEHGFGAIDCPFNKGIQLLGKSSGKPIFLDYIGVPISPPGPLSIDREELLNALAQPEVKFIWFATNCGHNAGEAGAKGVLTRIARLGVGQTSTLRSHFYPGGVPFPF